MFSGPLVQLPIEPAVSSQAENYKQYMVHLTDIGITVPNGTELTAWYIADVSFSEYVMVDSGATLNFLPDQIINRTLKAMGGTRTANGYFVDCKWLSRPGSFDLYFKDDGFEISVPWKDFLLQEGDLCKLGVAPAIPGVAPLLGVTFMRGAYREFSFSASPSSYSAESSTYGFSFFAHPSSRISTSRKWSGAKRAGLFPEYAPRLKHACQAH